MTILEKVQFLNPVVKYCSIYTYFSGNIGPNIQASVMANFIVNLHDMPALQVLGRVTLFISFLIPTQGSNFIELRSEVQTARVLRKNTAD